MKQLIQDLNNGALLVEDVPPPALKHQGILVQNHFSLISAGTEKSTVAAGRASLLGKARQRPDLVKQVWQNFRREGLLATIKKVRSRLGTPKPLGYSSAGVVLESNCPEFQVGDPVACAGGEYAHHAEIIFVPKNLATKIPTSVPYQDASFTTLAAIAMQGVRQADIRLGEHVVVIGLGLVGQLTVQLLKAAGCSVIGLDLEPSLLKTAEEVSGCDVTGISGSEAEPLVSGASGGLGADAVILTAGTKSNQPLELAIELVRKKGTIVVVGGVGMRIPREPFYRKELALKISCSYGPGRYDPGYEEQGLDYPAAYVRWTENRNMGAVLALMASGKLQVSKLVSKTFDIDEAQAAYDQILTPTREALPAVLLAYPTSGAVAKRIQVRSPKAEAKGMRIGVAGAGSFARNYLIPHMKDSAATLVGLCNATGVSARSAADRFGFAWCTTDFGELLTPDINTIFIATRHHLHAQQVIEALKAGKHVFVEKPLCLTAEELAEILDVFQVSNRHLMVGFNRRFSPYLVKMRDFFSDCAAPLFLSYRVNAGGLAPDHWALDPRQGGGRVLGEVCHFVDSAAFLCGGRIASVYAEKMDHGRGEDATEDNLTVLLKMDNGSLATISYLTNGDTGVPKERIELSGSGRTAMLENFNRAEHFRDGRSRKLKFKGKGHREEVMAFLRAVESGADSPISMESLAMTTRATLAILASLRSHENISLEPSVFKAKVHA